MSQKWIPKDPEGTIGVPGKGYIKTSDFTDDDLNNLIERAKNRKLDVHSFLFKCGLVPATPQLELEIDDSRDFEKDNQPPSAIDLLREEYFTKSGKKADNRWKEEKLKEKIAELDNPFE